MKWTNEELQDIAENRYGLTKESHQESFILGVDFALQQLGFEDYDGRLVNDGGKHYIVEANNSIYGKIKTFFASETEANQGLGATKLAKSVVECLGMESICGTSEARVVEGEGSLTGETFVVFNDEIVMGLEEAMNFHSERVLARMTEE